jgi:hypothetical protein
MLKQVVSESYLTKVRKNTRTTTQTVFYLKVKVSPLADKSITISNADLSRIRVKDDKNNTYPVLTMTPDEIDLEPDSEQTFVIRADGSPSILVGAKSMELVLAPAVFGNSEPIVFSQKLHDMDKKRVDGFD